MDTWIHDPLHMLYCLDRVEWKENQATTSRKILHQGSTSDHMSEDRTILIPKYVPAIHLIHSTWINTPSFLFLPSFLPTHRWKRWSSCCAGMPAGLWDLCLSGGTHTKKINSYSNAWIQTPTSDLRSDLKTSFVTKTQTLEKLDNNILAASWIHINQQVLHSFSMWLTTT